MTSFSVRRVPSRSEIEPPSVEELGSDLVDDDDDDLETIVLPGSGPGDLPHSFSGMHVRDVDGRPRDPRVEVRRLSATERSTQSSGQLLLFRR